MSKGDQQEWGLRLQQIGCEAVVVLSMRQVADLEMGRHGRSLSDVFAVVEGVAGLVFGRR